MADVAVEEIGDQGQPQGGHDLRVVADHLEVRQGEHVLDLLGRKPGLRWLAELHAGELGQLQERLPEAAVAVDEDPGAGVADCLQLLEHGLHVGEVGDDVDEEDHIEGTPGTGQDVTIGHVPLDEAE